MDILLIGGTQFIGRAIAQKLLAAGHRLTLLHRGEHPADGPLAEVEQVRYDRARFPEVPAALAGRKFDVCVDTCAMQPGDVESLLEGLRGRLRRFVLLSSVDVYEAFGTVLSFGAARSALPLDEGAPLRVERFVFRGLAPDREHYEKLDCEAETLAAPGVEPVILRLPFVYGPNDYRRREWFYLRRIRRQRPVVLGGSASWLGTRTYVGDAARATELAATHPAAAGEVFVVGEPRTPTLRHLAEQIGDAAGFNTEIVELPDPLMPPHLSDMITRPQHLLFSSEKIRHLLGFREERGPEENLKETVRWHMANAPREDEAQREVEERAEAEAIARWRRLKEELGG
jgi:nucleoside-diphosphate-sugar epimerase